MALKETGHKPTPDKPATGVGPSLTEKAIRRLASEARFKLEVLIMRDDYQSGTAAAGTLSNQIQRLARDYDMPPWFVRGLVEQ